MAKTILNWLRRHFTCPDCGGWNVTMLGQCIDCTERETSGRGRQ